LLPHRPDAFQLEIFMQIKAALKRALFYARNVISIDLGISLLVAVSYLFFGKFTFLAYSERLFWTGLGMTLVAALVAFGATFSGRSFGIPAIIRKPEEAKRLLDNMGAYRTEVERRNDISIQIFFIGLGCIAISALVQTFLS
jgi:hypothetical protein